MEWEAGLITRPPAKGEDVPDKVEWKVFIVENGKVTEKSLFTDSFDYPTEEQVLAI